MGLTRRILSLLKPKQEEEKSTHFLQNGIELLAELIAFSNGRYDIPIRSFTAQELVRATNSFAERVFAGRYATMFRGHFEGRQVLIRHSNNPSGRYVAIRDIVIASHMRHHKNVLKLVGYCLEVAPPASVYEYAEGILLSDLLDSHNKLSWKSRIKIASDIASAVVYLHTAFSTPVIYRDLKPSKVFIDQYGVSNLYCFALSISLPPGELRVQDGVVGTDGFLDPEYESSGYVTQKTDVYSFGVLLLTLLTGKHKFWEYHEGVPFLEYVKNYADNHQFDQLIDPRILEEEGGLGSENLLQSFLHLALMCTREKGEERPDMIDVAKQLRMMAKAHP